MKVPGWSWSLLDQGLASAATVAVAVAVGRLAGAEVLGQFSAAFAVALFIGSVHQALVSAPLTSLAAGLPPAEREAHLARLARWHRKAGWLAVPLAVLGAGCAALVSAPETRWLWAALAALAVGAAAGRTGIEFRRRAAYLRATPAAAVRASAWANGPALVIAALLGLGCAGGPQSAAIIALGALGFGALLGCWLAPSTVSDPAPAGALARAHWLLGRWHLVSLLVLWLTNYAFGWYLTAQGQLDQAGYLQAARTMLGLPLAALLAFDAWFQPRGREAWVTAGTPGFLRVAVTHGGLAAAVALPCAALMWLAAEPLTVLIFGEQLRAAAPAVALTAWCALWAVPDRLLGLAISARLRPQATAAGFVVCLGLTLWLLPLWVAEGAIGCARLLAVHAAVMVIVPGAWIVATWKRP